MTSKNKEITSTQSTQKSSAIKISVQQSKSTFHISSCLPSTDVSFRTSTLKQTPMATSTWLVSLTSTRQEIRITTSIMATLTPKKHTQTTTVMSTRNPLTSSIYSSKTNAHEKKVTSSTILIPLKSSVMTKEADHVSQTAIQVRML